MKGLFSFKKMQLIFSLIHWEIGASIFASFTMVAKFPFKILAFRAVIWIMCYDSSLHMAINLQSFAKTWLANGILYGPYFNEGMIVNRWEDYCTSHLSSTGPYLLFPLMKTWKEADKHCRDLKGHLTTISSMSINDYLRTQMEIE